MIPREQTYGQMHRQTHGQTHGQTNKQTHKQMHARTNIYSIFRDKLSLHGSASLGWSMVGGNTRHLLGVTDKILTHTEIKHYTNVEIHNDYTSAITVIGTIRYYRTEYNRKQ